MGRTSKFFFPLPGRRTSVLPPSSRSDNTNTTATTNATSTTARAARPKQQPLSKAQRLLGTAGDLNIDSPTRDDDGTWHSYTPSSTRSRSATSQSRISIEIAESTEDDSDIAGGDMVPPIRLNGKASSTLLGGGAWGGAAETAGEDAPSERPDVRSERSNSTLRSYYDRASTPLAISQQTSASSARDLALRKGVPPVVSTFPSSPLRADPDDYDETREMDYFPPSYPNQEYPKKKNSRLDLARLFHKSRDGSSLRPPSAAGTSRAPSIMSGLSEGPGGVASPGRRLTKNPPVIRKKSSVASPPVDRLRDEKSVQFKTDTTNDNLWNHYEAHTHHDLPPISAPPTTQLPSAPTSSPRPRHEAPNGASYPDLRSRDTPTRSRTPRDDETAPVHNSPRSAWRTRDHLSVTTGGQAAAWDSTSRVSDSSKTTGTSRRSVFSNSNLQQNSILSLSESSSDDDEAEAERSGDMSDSISDANDTRRDTAKKASNTAGTNARPRQKPNPLLNLDAFPRPLSSTSQPSTKSSSQNDYLATPSPISPHLRGPWHSSPPRQSIPRSIPGGAAGVARQPSSASGASTLRSLSSTRTTSTLRSSAPRSGPPREGLPSPSSPSGLAGLSSPGYGGGGTYGSANGYGIANGGGSQAQAYTAPPTSSTERFMTVTAQEQALLSALRKKRARMRDEILAEGVLEFGNAGAGYGVEGGGGGGGLAPRNSTRSTATATSTASSSGYSSTGGARSRDSLTVFGLEATREGQQEYTAFVEEGEPESEREREKERERQSFFKAISQNNAYGRAGGGPVAGKVAGRGGVRLSAVGSVGGEGFGW